MAGKHVSHCRAGMFPVRRTAEADKRQLQGVIEGLRRDVAALQVRACSCCWHHLERMATLPPQTFEYVSVSLSKLGLPLPVPLMLMLLRTATLQPSSARCGGA